MSAHTFCTNPTIEEIRNGNDVVIGGQCKTCLTVLWGIGTCEGCGKQNARLTYVLGTGARYCGSVCHQRLLKKRKAEADARDKAEREKKYTAAKKAKEAEEALAAGWPAPRGGK